MLAALRRPALRAAAARTSRSRGWRHLGGEWWVLVRWASTRRSEAEGISFKLSEADGVAAFERWAAYESGLLWTPRVLSVKPLYLPHWHVEGHATVSSGAHGGSTTHVDLNTRSPLAQMYAGHTYRRAMVAVAKNRGGVLRPFDARMLVPGAEVDEWSVFETTALALVREQVLRAVAGEAGEAGEAGGASGVSVALTVRRTRRVFHPAFLIEYRLFGRPWRVFVNGVTGEAEGIVHDPWLARARRSVDGTSGEAEGGAWARWRPVGLLAALRALKPAFLLQSVLGGGAYWLYRRLAAASVQKESYRSWEETKARERHFQRVMEDTWLHRAVGDAAAPARDEAHRPASGQSGSPGASASASASAASPRRRRRTSTGTGGNGTKGGGGGGPTARAEGSEEGGARGDGEGAWSAFREEMEARERAERAERARRREAEAAAAAAEEAAAEAERAKEERARAERRQRAREEERRRREEREREKRERWRGDGVDEGDYYAVLGLPGPEATSDDVRKAFRLQMMRWHPDHAREVPQEVATQRTQAIVRAYGVLRHPGKREAYDATYARRGGRGWFSRWV